MLPAVLAGILAASGSAGAGAADDQWLVARAYYAAGDWRGAECELLRYGVLYPDAARCADGARLRALCLWQAGAPGDALQALSGWVDSQPQADPESGRLLCTMLMEQGHCRLAAYRLRQMGGPEGPDDDLRFLLGWNELLQQRIGPARIHFASVQSGEYAAAAARLVPALGVLERDCKKSAAAAGWLSFLLPGSGQAYCGRGWEAAGSLGINALFGWWIYSLTRKEKYWTAAGVYAFGGVRYHLGGAVRAYRMAKKINREHLARRIEGLKRESGYEPVAEYGR